MGMTKGRKMKYIAAILLAMVLAAALFFFLRYSVGNHKYYKYRDLAIAACKDGDTESARNYIQVAIGYAKDSDLISEGQHYRFLFEHGRCEKE
jgi:hypothetical protein